MDQHPPGKARHNIMEKSKAKLLRIAEKKDIKPGVKVVCSSGDEGLVLAAPNSRQQFAVEWEGLDGAGGMMIHREVEFPCDDLRLAPRSWVEGKPAYDGDRLYGLVCKQWGTAKKGGIFWDNGGSSPWGNYSTTDDCCAWERPTETKTAHVLVFKAQTFDTREAAEAERKKLIAQLGGNSAEQIFVGVATWEE